MDIIEQTFWSAMRGRHVPSEELPPLAQRERETLLWAVDGVGPDKVLTVCRNWLELDMAERWWFYRMGVCNAGWRRAIRFGLGG